MRILLTLLVIVAVTSAVFFFAKPGAERQAIRFGRAAQSAISNEDILNWAQLFSKSSKPEKEYQLDIPSSKWPNQIKNILKDNTYAKVFVTFDDSNHPNGLIIQDGITGIVIPLNSSIPDINYFSIHMVSPSTPYFAFSIYK